MCVHWQRSHESTTPPSAGVRQAAITRSAADAARANHAPDDRLVRALEICRPVPGLARPCSGPRRFAQKRLAETFERALRLWPPFFRNSIALAHYPIDAKPVEPKRDDSSPEMLGNGNMYLTRVTTATQIPYGAILPREVEGLLVPTALSATHVAFSSIRQDPFWVPLGQAAGVAAALSVHRGVLPRQLPIEDLQSELLKQKCKLVYFRDLAATHPQFAPVQRIALRGIVTERPGRSFGPDEPLTRGDAARMAVAAFDLWPSVTHSHFDDVPYTHPAFRAVETLTDSGLLESLGFAPLWRKRGRFDPARDRGYQSQENYGRFEPDRSVSGLEFAAWLRAVKEHVIQSPGKAEPATVPATMPPIPGAKLTRAMACDYIEKVLAQP